MHEQKRQKGLKYFPATDLPQLLKPKLTLVVKAGDEM